MPFELPALPYAEDALAPHISAETVSIHYGRHHRGYVTKLNALTNGTADADKSLDDLVKSASGGVFNCAAQTWNHTFYWKSMCANGGGEPTGAIAAAIDAAFGDFASFKKQFSDVAAGHFGSGWAWLVQGADGKLQIVGTHDAANPIRDGLKPILTCDVAGQDGLEAIADGVGGVVCANNLKLAVGALNEPGPAASKVSSGHVGELLLERSKVTKSSVNGCGNGASGLAATVGTHGLPVEGVVPCLRGAVEHTS